MISRTEDKVKREAYLYSIQNNVLVEDKGIIHVYVKHSNFFPSMHIADFLSLNSEGKCTHTRQVPLKEGVISNKQVWLFEADKKRAMELFIADEEQEIEKLELAKSAHAELITHLKTEVEAYSEA